MHKRPFHRQAKRSPHRPRSHVASSHVARLRRLGSTIFATHGLQDQQWPALTLASAFGASETDAAAQPKNGEAYDLFLRSVAVPLDPADVS